MWTQNAMINGPAALRVISGVGAKGPACFLLEMPGLRLMLDLGEGPPPGLLPDIAGIGPVDALVLSHGHKDHVGGLPLLPKLGNPPIYASEIVGRGLPKGIAKGIAIRPLPVGGTADVLGIAVTTGRNGHAPGGVWLRFAVGGGGFIYSGDISAESILYAYDPPPATATALLDCSYAGYDKTLADCWANLAPLLERGPVLLPVPANGRGPEIALAIARHGRTDIFVDDTMLAALRRLSDTDSISLRAGTHDEIENLADAVKPIGEPRGVMLAASADGSSGATARLLAAWEHEAGLAIVFTGYVTPNTPAERLVKSGRAQFVRWNVHPRLSDTIALVRDARIGTVIPAFCDRSQLAGLATALAPARVTMDGTVML
jgi:Cft2 family RNA processing exonuclease